MVIKLLELFGGIGAPRCALRNLGVTVKSIDYVEIDEKAVRSYNAMFKQELPYKAQDIREWNKAQDIRKWSLKTDILVHGSPCQDFSIAGYQKGADEGSGTRSSLMWETLKIIEGMGPCKPKIVIWENVKNVLSKSMYHNFKKYLDCMEKLGYTNSYQILDARDFGLPQARQRVFTVSILGGVKFDFSKMAKRPMKPISELLESETDSHYEVTQPSMIKKIVGDDNSSFSGRVSVIKDFAYTITCKQMRCPNSGVIDLGNGKYRYLTEKECFRLQGYTDKDFEAAASVTPGKQGKLNGALYKQAGNSIPVTIFESMFEVMLKEVFEC